jgi:hypothetical protein
MYTVEVTVKGTAPLIQHRFPIPELADMSKGGKKQTGATDYTQEWRDYFYATSAGQIYQPSTHFEGAMTKAAVNFKVAGKRGKSYKDLFSAAVFVTPDEIFHEGFFAPPPNESLDTDGDKPLYLDVRPVVVNRSRVVRIRPAFKAGWELSFCIEVIDDSINAELINDVLALAGKTVGVGDNRPKFGRFMVTRFEVRNGT